MGEDFLDQPIELTHNFVGQHTLHWKKPISAQVNGRPCTLAPGSASLQTSPKVERLGHDPFSLYGDRLIPFIQFLVLYMDGDASGLWDMADHVGAMLIHALLLSNSDEAMQLVIALVHH